MKSKSDLARAIIEKHPDLPSREVARRIGTRTGFVSTLKWKIKNYDRWLLAHRLQTKASYERHRGILSMGEVREHEAWIIKAYAAGMTRPEIARKLDCSAGQIRHVLSHPVAKFRRHRSASIRQPRSEHGTR